MKVGASTDLIRRKLILATGAFPSHAASSLFTLIRQEDVLVKQNGADACG